MKKRLLAWILVLVMVIALLPTAVLAEGETGTALTVTVNDSVSSGSALESAVNALSDKPEKLEQITALAINTADGIMLTIDDTDYIKSTFTGLKTLDLTNADFIDNQGDGKNNSIWVHPWKGNTADIEHQFPDCAFQNNKTLETLIFGSKIKSIGAFAFSGCTSLKEIRFVNSSLEAIDNDAFRNTAITSVEIPDTVSYMGYGIFYGTKLTSVRLPDSLRRLSHSTFGNCVELTAVDLNQITEIGGQSGNEANQNAVFFNCDKLKVLRLPATLTTLGGQNTALATGCDDIIVDATACPNVKVGACAFNMHASWGGGYSGSALVYVQKATDNVTAKDGSSTYEHYTKVVTVAITNGGIFLADSKFESGKLAAPVKDGCKFIGWYKDADFNTPLVEEAPVSGRTYYAKWEASEDNIPSKPVNERLTVDLGTVYYGETPSATVLFDGADELEEVKSDHDYFDAVINDMNVTITPKAGLQPGTYTDTLYVYTEHDAVHFITVTLTVTPKPEDSQQEADAALSGILAAITGTNPFSDVPGSAYYNAAVRWAVRNGIASGTDAKHFSPDAACTRGQAVTFLWRAAGCPAPALAENPFADVKSTDYCYDAVLWAVQTGVAKGTSASTFSPDAACTRGQIVTFLYRAAGSPSGYANSGYTDVPETSYCSAPVAWAVALRVTSGTSALTFSPDALCTRAQIVTFLYRANA